MDTAEEYDRCAKSYAHGTKRDLRKFSYDPLLSYLPDLKGKKVLDVACGNGGPTLELISRGADVKAFDVSPGQVELAKEQGIDCIVHDAIDDFSFLGRFDVVTAFMFLHYFKTEDKLQRAVNNVSNALNPGGLFYTITVEPEMLKGYDQYGIRITPKEGNRAWTELFDAGKKFSEFSNFYHPKKTYDRILSNHFDVKWHDAIVSEEGIEKYGYDFWKSYLKNPIYIAISCKKKEKI